MADLLSINKAIGLSTSISIYLSIASSQTAWQAAKQLAIYSNSQVDNATTSCFLAHQDIGVFKNLNM